MDERQYARGAAAKMLTRSGYGTNRKCSRKLHIKRVVAVTGARREYIELDIAMCQVDV